MSASKASDLGQVIKQHLIDPEVCIRCNTCESTCPVGAITHDARNYVVDVDVCNWCNECIDPCPTGSIDHYRKVTRGTAYSLEAQLSWDTLPEAVPLPAAVGGSTGPADGPVVYQIVRDTQPLKASSYGSKHAPPSAMEPAINLVGPKAQHPTRAATVVANHRLPMGAHHRNDSNQTHFIELDLGDEQFPLLEGQRVGVLPPGFDEQGQRHHPRQYSVASARTGEHEGKNTVGLIVKRVVKDHDGHPVRGLASNYLCDAQFGETIEVTGPFGSQFLMPNHRGSSLVMICTGTGSAPIRAMIEHRRRLLESGSPVGGKLMLFFGARSPEELPYFGALESLPRDFLQVHFAFSRVPGTTKRHVQDVLRDRASDLALMLRDPNAYFYVCGLKDMDDGVLLALKDIAIKAGLGWNKLAASLKDDGRLHFETY